MVFGAALLTWTRTITWNVPGTKGFDVYACTESGGVWSLTTNPPTEIPTSGSVDISSGPYPWTEYYWIANTGNIPVQIQMNGQSHQDMSGIVWTFEYDSVAGPQGNPSIGQQWSGQQGWNVNLQVGEYVVFRLDITPPIGQGSYAYTFYGS